MFHFGKFSVGGAHVYNETLPELLTPEASYQLWLILRTLPNGDTVVNTLIEGNMRIAAGIAARYAQTMRWAKQDIFSEAMLGLTQAIQKSKECSFENGSMLRGYIRKTIHGAIGQYLMANMNGFKITNMQVSRIKKGKDAVFKSLSELPSTVEISNQRLYAKEEGKEHLIDRMERLMKDAGLTELEYEVMVHYLTGHTEEEIATILNVTRGLVQRRKAEAAEKLRYVFFEDYES